MNVEHFAYEVAEATSSRPRSALLLSVGTGVSGFVLASTAAHALAEGTIDWWSHLGLLLLAVIFGSWGVHQHGVMSGERVILARWRTSLEVAASAPESTGGLHAPQEGDDGQPRTSRS